MLSLLEDATEVTRTGSMDYRSDLLLASRSGASSDSDGDGNMLIPPILVP